MCMHEYFANVMNLHFLWLYREDYVAIACACMPWYCSKIFDIHKQRRYM